MADQVIPENSGPLFGEWCIADADLTFVLHRLILNNEEHLLSPKAVKYAKDQWNRATIQEFVNHPRKPFTPY